mmetsp:Transcript_3758/g.11191  ORF Transcript_3758/g.11191 Transcript_3758/m.11191 type:complete len:337 (+) Transcript_3758:91-1101(+)
MDRPIDVTAAEKLGCQKNGTRSFPAVVYAPIELRSAEAAERWAKTEGREVLERVLEQHGALLFRGIALRTPQEFSNFITAFDGLDFSMESPLGGGGPRLNVTGPVHTSTESPPQFRIPFHHELAYISAPPTKLFFWCEVAPEKDGETPILLSNRVVKRLEKENAEFVQNLREKKVKYVRTLDAETGKYQRGWKESFKADTKEQAEQNALLCGTETVEWLSGDRMRVTTKPFEAVVQEPRTGTDTWFNAVCLLHPAAHGKATGNDGADDAERLWDVVYGDGFALNNDDVIQAKKIMDEEGAKFQWQPGDVLVVDNMLALHSRNSFEPPRRILVAMTN